MPFWAKFRPHPLRWLFSLSLDEASFGKRGFTEADPAKRLSLEATGKAFIGGYNAAIAADRLDHALQHVDAVCSAMRGFAVEGAAMGYAVADSLRFRAPLLADYIRALDNEFSYLTHVGVGWAVARVPWRAGRIFALLDPVHHWLAYDGLGFHDAYFHHRRGLTSLRRRRSGYAARAYDQGVGRALWFISGGSTSRATELISGFAAPRRSDLWSGLGLAMAYAGPADANEFGTARHLAGEYGVHFAQGLAFACEARTRARHVPAHTELAAKVATGFGADELSWLVRETRNNLPASSTDPPLYEVWRRNVAFAVLPMLERQS